MWFTSVYLKTLRDSRIAIGACGLGLGALMAITIGLAESQLGTPQARAALLELAQSFRWYSEPVEITTPGGFATWRLGPFLALLPAIWALLAGSRALRGEEDRGSLDVLLSTPRSRARVALENLAALATAALLVGVALGLPTLAAGASVGAGFGPGAALLTGLNVALNASVFGSLALLISQFTRERGPAAALAGALLALSFVVDATGRTIPQAGPIRWLSPVYYFGLSKPLVPGHGAHPAAMLVLALLAGSLGAAGVALFLRRDIGAPVRLRAPAQPTARPGRAGWRPVRHWSVRSLYARSLGTLAVPTLWWALALAAYGAWMTALAKQTQANLAALYQGSELTGQLAARLGGGDPGTSAGYLNLVVFSFLPLLLAAFAVTQVGRWAGDEEDGRLELLLVAPSPRPHVILARFAALATAVALLGAVVLAAVAGAVAAAGLAIDGGRLVAAVLAMEPVALTVAAVGYLLAGWLRPAAVTGMLTALIAGSFFLGLVGPGLHWPERILQLSLFAQYGTPLLTGPDWAAMLRLLALSAGALAAATVRFARKDLAR